MRAFCYIQKKYYKWKIDLIADDLFKGEKKNCEIEIVYPENFSLNTLSKKKKYDFLVGCNVDDFKFQLLYKFLDFDKFITFDEGQRNINENDKYYSKNFSFENQKKFYFLNKICGFPLPFGKLLEKSDKHYSFFDPKIFNHPIKSTTFLKKKKITKKITKIFFGVSSNWVFSHREDLLNKPKIIEKKINEAALKINKLCPDLYIPHPREDERILELLNENITVVNCPNGSEDFVNKLALNNEIEVFTEKSGIVFDLNKKIKISFIDLFNRFSKSEYDEFKNQYKEFKKSN